MKRFLNISEGVYIAVYAIIFLAINENKMILSSDISKNINVSESHLAKILQRLVKVGFIKSIRGSKGGYKLKERTKLIKLMDIYEAIEGPYNIKFEASICKIPSTLDKLSDEVEKLFVKYFSLTLKDIIKSIDT